MLVPLPGRGVLPGLFHRLCVRRARRLNCRGSARGRYGGRAPGNSREAGQGRSGQSSQTMAAEAKQAQEQLMKKAEQIANDEAGLLARSDPYQSKVGITAEQLQCKSDTKLAKEMNNVHKQGTWDKQLARQLAARTDATDDP